MNEKNSWHSLFPNAVANHRLFEIYFEKLTRKFQVDPQKIIPAYSLCPDELNQEVIQLIHRYFGLSFALGGLAGYPFSGETGFNAFGDHIPDGGDAFIFFGPHLAVGAERFGYIRRRGQSRDTLSCGAALGVYRSLQNGDKATFSEDDYQCNRIRAMLDRALDENSTQSSELQVIDIIFKESSDFIQKQARRIKEKFAVQRIFLLGGLVLNTPVDQSDYIDVRLSKVI